MLPLLLPITALLVGTALMLMGVGLTSTLVAVRGTAEGFSDGMLGLIGSAYFVGFFGGTFIAPPLIRRMGHVRAFAFFASAVTSCILLHALYVSPWFWLVLRIATGLGLLGLYAVIESWLNGHAPPARRGQIFATYMAVNLGALALTQQFLRVGSVDGFLLFAIAAIMVCLAVMPVTVTRLQPPALGTEMRLSLRQLRAAAPAAVIGAVLSGIAMGAFWLMGAVYARRLGMDAVGVGSFMTVTILGGALLQWPLGRLSDRGDRRKVLAVVAASSALAALLMLPAQANANALMASAFLFGAVAFAVQPICVAHLIDHLSHEEILAGTTALLLMHGVGSALGPALAGQLMGVLGADGLPLLFALMFVPVALVAMQQVRRSRDRIVEEAAHFVPIMRTSSTVLEMMAAEQPGAEASASAADDGEGGPRPAGASDPSTP